MTTAFWYRAQPNFGDQLMPVLWQRLFGVTLRWRRPSLARLFGIGSIAARIPAGFTGWVWGTGKMRASQRLDLSAAKVLALRGPLTAEGSGAEDVLLADPGLLASLLLRHPARKGGARHATGVVPHYADDTLDVPGWHIDVQGGVDHVISEIASCGQVVTSSLHALIAADSMGIPSMWVPSPAVVGDGFKFHDYQASFDGRRMDPHVWRLADQRLVAAKREALLDSMQAIAQDMRDAA